MIALTPVAQDKLADVLKANPDVKAIRMGIRGGGCSGFEYVLQPMKKIEGDFESFLFGDVTVVVDSISMMYLDGVTLDYHESLQQSGFIFENPNVRSQCGCGKSFSA